MPKPDMATLAARLHRFLIGSGPVATRRQTIPWYVLSLVGATLPSLFVLRKAFSGAYVVQDDARQHVFWMRRFLDPGLFPNDVIADYFQSVAPYGYALFYWLFAQLGIDPLLLNKLLPPLLGLVTTGYCFGVSMRILPVPFAAFISTVLLNQYLWRRDDLASATPRAFLYPLFLSFLYYLLRHSPWGYLSMILLLGLFYPQYMLVAAGTLALSLLRWRGGRVQFTRDPVEYLLATIALGTVLLVMVPYSMKSAEFGPVFTEAGAKGLPEYWPGGRTPFFNHNPWYFWLFQTRSGLFHEMLDPPGMWLGFLLPVLLVYRERFPLALRISKGIRPLPQIVACSVMLFLTAHLFLFKLHYPARYVQHSLSVVMVFAAAIVLVVALDGILLYWSGHGTRRGLGKRQVFAYGSIVVLGAVLLYPSFFWMAGKAFVRPRYIKGNEPSLYEFFSRQPKDTLVGSLVMEADNFPSFSGRSILVSYEYLMPFHLGYYGQIRQRFMDLIRIQYSEDPVEVLRLIQRYGLDFLVVDRRAFSLNYISSQGWLKQFQPAYTQIVARLQQGARPALARFVETCTVFETTNLLVLEAGCLVEPKNSDRKVSLRTK